MTARHGTARHGTARHTARDDLMYIYDIQRFLMRNLANKITEKMNTFFYSVIFSESNVRYQNM
jgi:hypothetical protein